MVDGKCSTGYPKAFQEFKTMDGHGYPLYNRPDDERAYEVGSVMVDNRWITALPVVRYEGRLHVLFGVTTVTKDQATRNKERDPWGGST